MIARAEVFQGYLDSLKQDIEMILKDESYSKCGLSCCESTELQVLEEVYSKLSDIDLDISYNDALEIVQQQDDWMDDIDTFEASNIAGVLPQIDIEELVRLLANGPDLDVASKLYEELKYWKDKGRI